MHSCKYTMWICECILFVKASFMPAFPFFTHKQISVAATEIILQAIAVAHTHTLAHTNMLSFSLVLFSRFPAVSLVLRRTPCCLHFDLKRCKQNQTTNFLLSLSPIRRSYFGSVGFEPFSDLYCGRCISPYLIRWQFGCLGSFCFYFAAALIHFFLYFRSRHWLSQLRIAVCSHYASCMEKPKNKQTKKK